METDLLNRSDKLDHNCTNQPDYEPNTFLICCYCCFSPCINILGCTSDLIRHNKKKFIITVTSFILFVLGIIMFGIFYPFNQVAWLVGLVIAISLPIITISVLVITFVASMLIDCYDRSKRDLTNADLIIDEKNFIV